jgi:hypothetical protein
MLVLTLTTEIPLTERSVDYGFISTIDVTVREFMLRLAIRLVIGRAGFTRTTELLPMSHLVSLDARNAHPPPALASTSPAGVRSRSVSGTHDRLPRWPLNPKSGCFSSAGTGSDFIRQPVAL